MARPDSIRSCARMLGGGHSCIYGVDGQRTRNLLQIADRRNRLRCRLIYDKARNVTILSLGSS